MEGRDHLGLDETRHSKNRNLRDSEHKAVDKNSSLFWYFPLRRLDYEHGEVLPRRADPLEHCDKNVGQ